VGQEEKMKTWKMTILVMGMILALGCIIYVPVDEQSPRRPPRPADERYDERYDRDYSYDRGFDTSYFYDYLSPHGHWIAYRPYGYVWIPRYVGPQWRPYTYGRWIWTNFGWTWVSSYEWGWVPFHYGRWGWDNRLGWYWVPDTVWGPAWVTWRYGNNYAGWAPLPPGARYTPGYGIRGRDFHVPGNYWVFLDRRHFMDPSLNRHILPPERNLTVVNLTTLREGLRERDGRIFNEGIDVNQIRRDTGQNISPVQLRNAEKPGQSRVESDGVVVYRPSVTKNESARPKTVLRREDAETQIQRDRRIGGPVRDPESETVPIREIHERESRLMKETQEDEIRVLRRQAEEDKRTVRSETEKRRLDREVQTRETELKKKHVEEKSRLERRQAEEKKTVEKKGEVEKKTLKKKGDPDR
jgi:hypothetical protein